MPNDNQASFDGVESSYAGRSSTVSAYGLDNPPSLTCSNGSENDSESSSVMAEMLGGSFVCVEYDEQLDQRASPTNLAAAMGGIGSSESILAAFNLLPSDSAAAALGGPMERFLQATDGHWKALEAESLSEFASLSTEIWPTGAAEFETPLRESDGGDLSSTTTRDKGAYYAIELIRSDNFAPWSSWSMQDGSRLDRLTRELQNIDTVLDSDRRRIAPPLVQQHL